MKVHRVVAKYLARKKASAPKFSLRRLASELGLSAPYLSRVLRGEKPLSYELLLKLATPLEIEAEVLANLKRSYAPELKTKRRTVEVQTSLEDWELVDHDRFDGLRQWFYIPILEFTTLKSYDGSIGMIAERMGLSPISVGVAMRDLTAMGFLEEVDGRLQTTKKKFRYGSSKSLASIRKFHDQMLERARVTLREGVDEADFKRRLITGITITTSPERIEEAKRRLAELLHELSNDLIDDEGTEVYHLAAQLFPLTK